jgi:hypothetical protein
MKNYYAIIQVPVAMRLQFKAKDDEDAIKKAEKFTPFMLDGHPEVEGISCGRDSINGSKEIVPDYCELCNEDLCYLEVGVGKEYKDENSIIYKEDTHNLSNLKKATMELKPNVLESIDAKFLVNAMYEHRNHKVELAVYGLVNGKKILKKDVEDVALECLDCGCVIFDIETR